MTNVSKHIHGVRHKCLSCPDFDFCSTCVQGAVNTHPTHRFATLYDALPFIYVPKEIHRGIYCDGPICATRSKQSYIRGDRYKCAVCHDTDLCANCEALPTQCHNKTHPLIKIKTPIKNISITTLSQTGDGQKLAQMGDRASAKHAATATIPSRSTNAATQVQTVAEVKPAEPLVETSSNSLVSDERKSTPVSGDLQAWFESDSTPDGTSFGPNRLVSQSWTLRNPGPQAWPAGCAVYFIGGDDMRNLDSDHPSSVSDMAQANRSNVLEKHLEPGKTAVFTVLLKSPVREGRAISYWRLKTPEGLPFGHKLWVDITVATSSIHLIKKEREVEPVIASVPEPIVEVDNRVTKSEEGSIMIFPKLEKESPMSSMHENAEAPSVSVEPTTKTEDQELLEDVESLELEDDSDDGFMTDEEYDILDASDEDFFMEAQQAVTQK